MFKTLFKYRQFLDAEKITGVLGFLISLRVIYAIAKWRKLDRIEKKVTNG